MDVKSLIICGLGTALLSIGLPTTSAFSQDSVASPRVEAGPFSCKQLSSTSKVLYCSYRNDKYSHIVDIESIAFTEKTQVQEFCADIQEAYAYVEAGNQDEGTWLPTGVKAQIMAPWVGGICIWGDDGYTIIRPKEKEVQAVIDGLNRAANLVWE